MSFDNPDLSLGTRNFAAGFLDTPESDTLPDGAIVDGKNAWFHTVDLNPSRVRATSGKRPGSRLLTLSSVGTSLKGDGLVDFTQEANPSQLLAAFGGAWYRWNEFDALVAIPTATGYVGGNAGRGELFKNQALLYDGSKQQLYDGITARDVGFVKPTGVTAMTASGGPGVTGTYRARYTWFDQTHNHESSITDDATADLALTNQSRTHTKPSGTPPAHVTHWRAYVLRVDTSEATYMRVATVPIGDATVTEAVSDGARKDPAPLPGANDPPTLNFKVVAEYLGFMLGFDGSDMYVSKQGDCESWNSSDVLKVGPGDGKAVRSATRVGAAELIIQKPGASWHLVGSRMPFKIDQISPDHGNVSQESAVTVGGRLYAWDLTKGPYVTDLTTWTDLANDTIANMLETVRKLDAPDIRAAHLEAASLVLWAVPTIGSARKRTILAYHYGLGAWLPPITGLEYGALGSYLANDGTVRLMMADYWGRLWSLFDGNREAPTGGTVSGIMDGALVDGSAIIDSSASFVTTGAGLAGVPVAVQDPDTGIWQWRRCASNTATQINLDTVNGTTFAGVPFIGWRYLVGGIEWWQAHPWLDGGLPVVEKAGLWFDVQFKPSADDHELLIALRFNEGSTAVQAVNKAVTAVTNAALWGSALWGTGVWSRIARQPRKFRIGRAFLSVQVAFSNYEPDQPMPLTGYAIGADVLSKRTVKSAP